MNNKKIIITLVVLVWILAFIAGVVLKVIDPPRMCVDGFEPDNQKILQICGVTREQYETRRLTDKTFCPEAYPAAYHMVGGCFPEWGLAAIQMVMPSIIWFGLMALILVLIIKYPKIRRK